MRLDNNQRYLPIFYLDELGFRVKDLKKIDSDKPKMNLTVNYRSVAFVNLKHAIVYHFCAYLGR